MIVSYRPSWRGIIAQIAKPITASFILSVVVVFLYRRQFYLLSIPDLSVSMFGSALVIFLGFRTNAAYGRWWEARILWGSLVNQSRSWTRQVITYTRSPQGTEVASDFAREMVYWQIAFVYALRCHLRGEPFSGTVEPLLSELSGRELLDFSNVPTAILHRMSMRIADLAGCGLLSEFRFVALNQTLADLTTIQGGCERIRNTPFPRQYDYYPGLFIQIYCVLLPLAVIQDVGVLTPLLTLVISFALLVIDRIGKNLEDPFSSLTYGTPLTALSRSIEIDLRQQLQETDLPKPVAPVNGVLD
jgi:putative membrane protein